MFFPDIQSGNVGSSNTYIATEIASPLSNAASGLAPMNMILVPSSLKTPETLHSELFPTGIEIAWPTKTTFPVAGVPTVIPTVESDDIDPRGKATGSSGNCTESDCHNANKTMTVRLAARTNRWQDYDYRDFTVKCFPDQGCGKKESELCQESADQIVSTDVYSIDGNPGECHRDSSSKSGCQLEVQSMHLLCAIAGKSMKAAYNAIRKECGNQCGAAKFGDFGCQVGTMIVEDGDCTTKPGGGKWSLHQ